MHHIYSGAFLLLLFWFFGILSWLGRETQYSRSLGKREQGWLYHMRQPTALLFYLFITLTALFILISHYLGTGWGLLTIPLLLYGAWIAWRVRKLLRQMTREAFSQVHKKAYINHLIYFGIGWGVYAIYYILSNMVLK